MNSKNFYKINVCPKRATNTHHHMFGFHDIVQSNARGDLLLTLELDSINRPPLPNEQARAGVVVDFNSDAGQFVRVHDTCAFNYPQGARMQWVGDSDLFLCNDRVGNSWGARLSDARQQKVIETFNFPVHCLNGLTYDAFYPDYARLYRVGGYGYIGISDRYATEDVPKGTGIFKGNIKSGSSELLVSLHDVAAAGNPGIIRTGYPHYITHLVLNPSGSRIAFLHRFRVPDGGESTRLMTVGADGSQIRCLAKGFLSHFDWMDDESIFIWGSHQGYGRTLREQTFMGLPGVEQAARIGKKLIQSLRKNPTRNGGQSQQSKSFLKISDKENPEIQKVAQGVLTEDGHPMASPVDRSWFVSDTYPDAQGLRELILYNCTTNKKYILGTFRKIDEQPDQKVINLNEILHDVDPRVRKKFPLAHYLISRSGLHCDLHPRWSYDGKTVFFDSIHEGSRQIYMADVSKIIYPDSD